MVVLQKYDRDSNSMFVLIVSQNPEVGLEDGVLLR